MLPGELSNMDVFVYRSDGYATERYAVASRRRDLSLTSGTKNALYYP